MSRKEELKTLNLSILNALKINLYHTEKKLNICVTQAINNVHFSNIHSIKLLRTNNLSNKNNLCISGLERTALIVCFISIFGGSCCFS